MNHSHAHKAASTRSCRFKEAAIGFGVTVAPVVAMAALQFALLPQIVERIEGLTASDQIRAVASLRKDWLIFHAIVAGLVAAYWLLAGGLGKGQLLRSRAANITFVLFLSSLIALTIYDSLIHWPADLKGLCSLLGISDDYPKFAFDAQSSCDIFVDRTHSTIAFGLLGIGIILLGTSAVLRIRSSRTVMSS